MCCSVKSFLMQQFSGQLDMFIFVLGMTTSDATNYNVLVEIMYFSTANYCLATEGTSCFIDFSIENLHMLFMCHQYS